MKGSARVITFRSNRDSAHYLDPIHALSKGTSTGHIALELEFDDEKLFNKYVKGISAIPHRVITDPNTSKTTYQVYVSFWPAGEWAAYSDTSELRDYDFDCQQSWIATPVDFNPEFTATKMTKPKVEDKTMPVQITAEQVAKYISPSKLPAHDLERLTVLINLSSHKAPLTLEPLKKIISPHLPLLREHWKSQIDLGPSVILHATFLEKKYGSAVLATANEYANAYRDWCRTIISAKNCKHGLGEDHALTKFYVKMISVAAMRAKLAQHNLKHQMCSTNPKLKEADFNSELHKFLSFGLPERDSVTLPLIDAMDNPENIVGLDLEPILKFVHDVATKPNDYPYFVLGTNCAAIVHRALWEGVKDLTDSPLKKPLALAWVIEAIRLTKTPAQILYHAANAQHALHHRIESPLTQIYKWALDAASNAYNNVVQFSRPPLAIEDEETDPLLTTKAGKAAEVLRRVESYLR